jgi:hypothetical protein
MFTQTLITDLNDRPTLRAPLSTAILVLGCLVGLWFVAFAFLPKTEALAAATHAQMPRSVAIASGAAAVVRTLFYPAAVVMIFAFLVSRVGAFSFAIRNLAVGILRLSLIILVPVMGALLIVAWIGLFYVYDKENQRVRSMEIALERIALDETLNNRDMSLGEEMQTGENLEPIVIENITSELTLSEQRNRLAMLVHALETTSNPAHRKRLLATLPPFETLIVSSPDIHTKILEIATDTARETFEDIPDFFRWLANQPVSDGWEPIPLYRFVVK